MKPMNFAVIGAGFWAGYQVPAWGEIPGVKCVAICDRDISRAQSLAQKQRIATVYDDPEKLIVEQKLDFIDIVTDPTTHSELVHLAAKHRLPVICQKPLGRTVAETESMIEACRAAEIPLLVHENWRWQTPIRELKKVLDSGIIGEIFRARIDMVSGFPVFANQPNLVDLDQFILADMGSHILDIPRFLFGEPSSLYCQTRRTLSHVKGENVATVMMNMNKKKTTVICQMGYPEAPLENDCFPETLFFIEGDRGSVEIAPHFWLRITTKEGTLSRKVAPPIYSWANPEYAVVHSSMVATHANLIQHLRGEGMAETTGADNLKTIKLIFAAYDSAREDRVISFT